jgi:hypothetical protein
MEARFRVRGQPRGTHTSADFEGEMLKRGMSGTVKVSRFPSMSSIELKTMQFALRQVRRGLCSARRSISNWRTKKSEGERNQHKTAERINRYI